MDGRSLRFRACVVDGDRVFGGAWSRLADGGDQLTLAEWSLDGHTQSVWRTPLERGWRFVGVACDGGSKLLLLQEGTRAVHVRSVVLPNRRLQLIESLDLGGATPSEALAENGSLLVTGADAEGRPLLVTIRLRPRGKSDKVLWPKLTGNLVYVSPGGAGQRVGLLSESSPTRPSPSWALARLDESQRRLATLMNVWASASACGSGCLIVATNAMSSGEAAGALYVAGLNGVDQLNAGAPNREAIWTAPVARPMSGDLCLLDVDPRGVACRGAARVETLLSGEVYAGPPQVFGLRDGLLVVGAAHVVQPRSNRESRVSFARYQWPAITRE